MDSNPTRNRYQQNAKAFEEVFGNPYETDDEADSSGWYTRFKSKGILGACSYALDEGSGTSNPSRPSVYDFYIDATLVAEKVLKAERIALHLFWAVVILGHTEAIERAVFDRLVQKIGRLLRARRISPVSAYFRTVRRAPCQPSR